MWFGRGFPFDTVAFVNLAAIQAPAWVALWIAWRVHKSGR
jgi:hypothetical protein